ncbi:CHAT domain-containing protein [Streptomyces sp. NPDC087903]|uniref:CHAT domain-containing tetratricopeptide repeat protein n=1 Tax=Streptomyces sp. NPDC087903 TaxID=3365819 RepID=UPI0038012019
MSFEYWLDRVRRGIDAARERSDILLGSALAQDAANLWHAAQPADPGRPASGETPRLEIAAWWLGLLHSLRHAAMPEETGRTELARAILLLAPWAGVPGFVPESLRHLLGPTANPESQAQQAGQLVIQAMRTGERDVLDASIALHEAVLSAGPPPSGTTVTNAAAAYSTRYAHTGNTADLDRAIELGNRAAAYSDDPNYPTILSNLGTAYWTRYERAGRSADLDRAIEILARARSTTPPADPNRPTILSNLAAAHHTRHERTGALDDLDRAIEIGHATTASAEPHAAHLSNLGIALFARYERAGNRADLDRAIEIGDRARAAGPDSVHLPTVLSNLGISYHARFERGGDVNDLARAIECQEQAVAVTPDPHPDRGLRLNNLAAVHHTRFARTADPADLERAISVGEAAVAAMPADHPVRGACLSNVGSALHERFQRTGSVSDLHRAIDYGEQAVAHPTDSPPERGRRLSNLALAYQSRFERTGDLDDLHRAVERGEHAVAATPDDHPDRALYLGNLAMAYSTRHSRTGDVDDLDRAVEHRERAVERTPPDHQILAKHLTSLAADRGTRFHRTGDVADVDRAIEAAKRAVARTPADHPDLVLRLNNLGTALQARYSHFGDTADLNGSIEQKARALAATPADHPLHPRYATNLGLAHRARFARAGDLADLDRAVELCRLAVAATPEDHPDLAPRLSVLASAHLARHRRTESAVDLTESIALGERALSLAPHDHPVRPLYLSNLGVALQARFKVNADPADRDRMVDLNREALAATPGDHTLHAKRVFNLAIGLENQAGDDTVHRVDIQKLAILAVAPCPSPPADQVRAGWVTGRIAHAAGEHETARRLLDAAVALLPSVPARETSYADQEHRLDGYLGLVGEAVAVHCALDDPVGAIQAGEQGRGILLASQLDARTDLSGLQGEHPELARHFQQVRDGLSAPVGDGLQAPDLDGPSAHLGDERRRLWRSYDALLAEIRRLPGWDRFLLPPTWDDLRRAAAGRTVVLVNTGSRRSDAIIVTADAAPTLVPLPDLALPDVDARTTELSRATTDTGSLVGELRRQRILSDLLGWLWDTAVGPVLEALDRLSPRDGTRARVWWMPTGLLGLLPLHAAGRPGEPGALDRVVSSYTPTFRALLGARGQTAEAPRRQLTVALERTPGLPDLPATAAEATTLHARLPDAVLVMNEQATVDRVLTALPEARWAHFACHADTDLLAPSQGGLHLHDGLLPIAEISRLRLHGAELAYLSACSTGHVGRRHANESTHLASAFQLAGFRNVIASLWPLNDAVAATAADRFYRLLPPNRDADQAAVALHQVTRELRAEHTERPHLWASLIHSGP